MPRADAADGAELPPLRWLRRRDAAYAAFRVLSILRTRLRLFYVVVIATRQFRCACRCCLLFAMLPF